MVASIMEPPRHNDFRSIPGNYSLPPLRPSARSRVPTMPSANFCGAVGEDSSTLSPIRTPRRSPAVSCHTVRAEAPELYSIVHCGWRAWLSRARSPRRYYTSYQVRVPRPAHSLHDAFRPHLAVTPLRFTCPSAPRTPGQGTCTPKHDRMHGTHAAGERRATRYGHLHGERARRVARPLHWVVELSAPRSWALPTPE